jgi:hypothetical protein
MSDSSGQKSLASSGRPVHKNPLWLGNTEALKNFGVLDRKFDDFFNFSDLLLQASNHVIGGIRYFFDFHQTYKWVDHAWEHFVEGTLSSCTEGHSCVWHQGVNINFSIDINYDLAVSVLLNQALLLRHHFRDLSYLGSGLQKHVELLLQVLNHEVHFVTLSLETAQVVSLFDDFDFHLFNLLTVVGFESLFGHRLNEGLDAG